MPPFGPLLETLRPHQWVKNGFVLVPLLFAHKLGEPDSVLQAGVALAVFCALASAIYIVNDIADREADRAHPVKRDRPLAAGRLSVGAAAGTAALLALVAVTGSAWLTARVPAPTHGAVFWVWPAAYAVLNLGYSFALKHQVVLDCICIALGFQFRVQAGSAAIDVEASKWLLLCTFFFALFLAFCKRREELARSGGHAGTRRTMQHYSLPFLDQLIAPLAALSILTYALYTLDAETVARHGTKNLMFTVPIVVFGVFRYLFLIHNRGGGEDPARLLLRDPPILASVLLWLVTVWALVT